MIGQKIKQEAIKMQIQYPVIDVVSTGRNIAALRKARGLTVRDLQVFFGFENPQAIYKWQQGKCLPSVDNLLALSVLLDIPMDEILIRTKNKEPQALPAAPAISRGGAWNRKRKNSGHWYSGKPCRKRRACAEKSINHSCCVRRLVRENLRITKERIRGKWNGG